LPTRSHSHTNPKRQLRPIDLEPVVRAAVLRGQAHVVEHGPEIQQLVIDRPAPAAAPDRPEQLDPQGVCEQQRGAVLAQQFGRFSGKLAVGDSDPRDDFSHDSTPIRDHQPDVAGKLASDRFGCLHEGRFAR
jgi:hypothetical protein